MNNNNNIINDHDNFCEYFIKLNLNEDIKLESFKDVYNNKTNYISFFNDLNNLLIVEENNNINTSINKNIDDKIFIIVKKNEYILIIVRKNDIDYYYDLNGYNYFTTFINDDLDNIACYDILNKSNKSTLIIIYNNNQTIINVDNKTGKLLFINQNNNIYTIFEKNILIWLYKDDLPLNCFRKLEESKIFSCLHLLVKQVDKDYYYSPCNEILELSENTNLIISLVNSKNNKLVELYIDQKNILDNKILPFIIIENFYNNMYFSIGLFLIKKLKLFYYYLFNEKTKVGHLFNYTKNLIKSNVIINKCYVENEFIYFEGEKHKFFIKYNKNILLN